jgi:hypothetical protein
MKTQRGTLLNTKTSKSKSKFFLILKYIYLSKIGKVDSFSDFHTKRPKLQNRVMNLQS